MKLNNFELIIELREYLRDQAPTSYLTNYSLEDSHGRKTNDFTEIKDLGPPGGESSKGGMKASDESGLIIRRGKGWSRIMPLFRKIQ